MWLTREDVATIPEVTGLGQGIGAVPEDIENPDLDPEDFISKKSGKTILLIGAGIGILALVVLLKR